MDADGGDKSRDGMEKRIQNPAPWRKLRPEGAPPRIGLRPKRAMSLGLIGVLCALAPPMAWVVVSVASLGPLPLGDLLLMAVVPLSLVPSAWGCWRAERRWRLEDPGRGGLWAPNAAALSGIGAGLAMAAWAAFF